MSFQFVIDNAAAMSVNRRAITGQTITRSSVVRSVTRGTSMWRFEVDLPSGPRWSDYRADITRIEKLDLVTNSTIKFNNPGLSWFIQYQGDLANPDLVEVDPFARFAADEVLITSSPTLTSGFLFRSGDVIQLGSQGKCYVVVNDVAHNQTVIKLHRPKLNELPGTKVLRVGGNCEWTIRCIQFPEWLLFGQDQVSWSGSFVFVEVDVVGPA